MSLSPSDFAVISGAFRAVADEMGQVLLRAAHSNIIRESKDCSTCVFDANGDAVAQAEMIPIHMNSLAAAFEWIRRKYDLEALNPGDAFLLNNPYEHGQHLNDIILILPVFVDQTIVAYVGNIAHHIEVGGALAGSNANATELFQEGLILPSMRIDFERDLRGGPVEQIIGANVRCPDVVLGDLRAQISSVLRGRERVLELLERYGTDKIASAMSQLQDYSERMMRSAIDAIPDGVYEAEDLIDGFRAGDPLISVRARVMVSGSNAEVDLTESADQVAWPINSPLASTYSGAFTVFAYLLGKEAIINAGSYRPIKVITRKGSLFEPTHPAPVRGRMTSIYRAVTAIKRALGQAIPERVSACGSDSTCAVTLAHKRPDGYNMFTEVVSGGNGAAPGCDGADAVAQLLSNTGSTPAESTEQVHDFVRITEYCLIPDSGGAGEYRGGLGVRKRYEILADNVILSTNGDRQHSSPWGLSGGDAGSYTAYTIIRDGKRIAIDACSNHQLNRGDVFEMVISGGGGWGDPMRRQPESVIADIQSGRITRDAAKLTYSHAFRGNGVDNG